METSPTALERIFFSPLYRPLRLGEVFRWWEARRLVYNVSVGMAGLISIAVVSCLQFLAGRPVGFPLAAVLVYGMLANLAYTAGPVVDLLVRRRFGLRGAAAGPVLLRYGFVFSIGLSLLPIPVAVIGFLLTVLF